MSDHCRTGLPEDLKMIFKLLIIIMSLLICFSNSLHVPKSPLPSPWVLYRYDIIKALGSKRDDEDWVPKNCLDNPHDCPDVPSVTNTSDKAKKAYNKLNYIDIWQMLAEHSGIQPVILVSDLQNIPKK